MGQATDFIRGDAGGDVIAGGIGADTLTGGSESDQFIYVDIADAGDTITDFTAADSDMLDLRVLFSSFTGSFGATTASATTSGHLDISDDGNGNTVVSVDGDGGGDNFVQLALLQGASVADVDGLTFIA